MTPWLSSTACATTPNGVLKGGDLTYSEMVNLSMNQTLARSINTSLVAILPVLAVLVVGADIFGATTLQSYGLALFVGLMSGAYSSIFIASPLLAVMKEREPRYRDLAGARSARSDRTFSPPRAAAVAARRRRRRPARRAPMRSSAVPRTHSGSGSQTAAPFRLAARVKHKRAIRPTIRLFSW